MSFEGNFTEFWRAKQASIPRIAGRVATRGTGRRGARVDRASSRANLASLERRIEEAEEQRLVAEQQAGEAFARRDLRQGRRANRELERLKALLEDLYDRWVKEGG